MGEPPGLPRLVSRESQRPGWPGRSPIPGPQGASRSEAEGLDRVVRQPARGPARLGLGAGQNVARSRPKSDQVGRKLLDLVGHRHFGRSLDASGLLHGTRPTGRAGAPLPPPLFQQAGRDRWVCRSYGRPSGGAWWRAQSSAHRFLHERADLCLFGGSQLLQREGGRP